MKERSKKGKGIGGWEGEKKEFFENKGLKLEEGERRREKGRDWFGVWMAGKKRRQKEEKWKRIKELKFNGWYKVVKREGISEYLEKGWGESTWSRVATFRLWSEMKEVRYWETEEWRRCSLCEGKERLENMYKRSVGSGEKRKRVGKRR